MQDIADSLNISKNAVSLAINGKPGISEDLREKVLTAATRLGYFKVDQKKTRNNNLLLIMDEGRDTESDFFFPTISATIRYAKKKGYNVLVTSVNAEFQNQLSIPRTYYELKAEGVLFIGDIKRNFLQMFLDMGIPSVLMVQHLYGVASDNVISDNDDGGYVMTKHLIGLGHKKIGYIADLGMFESFTKRQLGYKKALEESQLTYGPYDYSFYSSGEKPSIKTMGPPIDKIMKNPDKPSAWLCGNDHTAIVLINEFRKRGIMVPDDVSVTGFDAISTSAVFNPAITTYDSRIDLIARYSVDLVVSHIENGHDNWNPVIISVIGRIINGESTRSVDG